METKNNLLNVSSENLSEAQFMCANFIDEDVKKRAFINTLGAETAIEYLTNNGINTNELRNMHSIKRVLEKVNIADIILPNIHIDVRVVFDEDKIFVPKSHFELGIIPNVYMVLKFNNNYETMEFLGYFEPKIVDERKCNDEFYFVDKSELISGNKFIDFVKDFVGNTEQNISDSEFFRGRELSVLASDDDITRDEFKQYLQMLKNNSSLRDSVLEYDNFETLSGRVASYMDKNQIQKTKTESEPETAELSVPEEMAAVNMDINQELDPNGEELINDDNFQNDFDMGNTDSPFSTDISGDSISDEAIELAGLAGDTDGTDSGFDVGMADFDLDTDSQQDNEQVDLFDSIDTNNISELPESEPSVIDTETGDEAVEDSIDNAADFENLELDADDLSDFEESGNEDLTAENDLQEIPTEAAEQELEDLSLSSEDSLLGDEIDLSADDLISMDDEPDEPVQNVGIDLERLTPSSEADAKIDLNTAEEISDMSKYESDNTNVTSYEEFNPAATEGDFGVTNMNDPNAEAVEFSDIEFDGEGIENSAFQQVNNQEDLYDIDNFSEITEEPINTGSDAAQASGEINDFDDLSEIITEAPEIEPEEVYINDNVLNNSPVIENSTVISDKHFEPGEILLDINKTSLPDFGDDNIGDLYNKEHEDNNAPLNNDVRIAKPGIGSISPKNGIIALLLVIAVAGAILFSVMKMVRPAKEDPNAIAGSLNPENKVDDTVNQDDMNVNPDNIVMNDEQNNTVNTVTPPEHRTPAEQQMAQNAAPAQTNPAKPIPPTAFLTVKKLSWEVPDYISYSAEFRQFFQSAGKSLKTALSSDLLLANDYTYSNAVKLSITFDKAGKFKDAKIISSSGSADVDKIVLQSVNQTLNILKAPNSLGNDENTTVILKIYL